MADLAKVTGTKQHEEELKESLRLNLSKHVSQCHASSEENNPASFTVYKTNKLLLFEKYTKLPYGLSEDRIALINQELEDEVFISQRQAVDSQLAILQSTTSRPFQKEIAYSTLAHKLFIPWYCQEHYFCSDYFARQGGIRFTLDVLRSDAGQREKVCALSVLWNFCSTEERNRLLTSEGIIRTLAQLLRDGYQNGYGILHGGMGLLWALIEFPDVQSEVIESGFLGIFCHILKDPDTDRNILKGLAGCLHMLCANANFAAEIIESGVIDLILACCKCLALGIAPILMNEQMVLQAEQRVKYLSCNAVACLCFRVGQKRWRCEAQGVPSVSLISEYDMDSRLKPVAEWIGKNDPDKEIQFGFFSIHLWLCCLVLIQ